MASTTYDHPGGATEMYAAQEQFRDITKMVTFCHRFAVLGNMVRNAGQLPYVERLPLPDIAERTNYSRTAIGYRLKGIDKMLDV